MYDDASMPPPSWNRHQDSPMALAEASGAEESYAYMTPTDPKVFDLLQSLPRRIHQWMVKKGRIVPTDFQRDGHICVGYRVKSFEGTLAEDGSLDASHRFEIVASLRIHVPGKDFSSRSWDRSQWRVSTTREPSSEEIEGWRGLLNKDERTVRLLNQGNWGYMLEEPVGLGEMTFSIDGEIIGSDKVEVSIVHCEDCPS